jgi:hypothetical protein
MCVKITTIPLLQTCDKSKNHSFFVYRPRYSNGKNKGLPFIKTTWQIWEHYIMINHHCHLIVEWWQIEGLKKGTHTKMVIVDLLIYSKDVNDYKSNTPFCLALHMTLQNHSHTLIVIIWKIQKWCIDYHFNSIN